MPMMRGFGPSQGEPFSFGCDVARTGLSNARDLRAVVDYLGQRPDTDTSRVIMSGQSFRGWNTIAYGALGDSRVEGLVEFAGGLTTRACADDLGSMARGMAVFGARAGVPTLWFHGDNDARFPPEVWRANHDRYVAAGGEADLVAYGAFERDAHNFLGSREALKIWTPKVDALLARLGLPSGEVFPRFLPHDPPATNYAAIDDLDAPPFMGDKARAFYRAFLAKPLPRALVISPGTYVDEIGGYDPLARAMEKCARLSALCQPYAYDDQVIWQGPLPGLTLNHAGAKITAARVALGETSVVARLVDLEPDCAPAAMPQARLTTPPAHGQARLITRPDHPRFAGKKPLAACNTLTTPMTVVEYTPAQGFAGVDFVSLVLTDAQGLDKPMKVAVRVAAPRPAANPDGEGAP